MPLYLVRWQDLSAALIAASDEDDLVDRLDELADPDGATWTEYDGPLWVEFELPVKWHIDHDNSDKPLTPDRVHVDSFDHLDFGGFDSVRVAGCDTGSEMASEIYARAFPKLTKALNRKNPTDATIRKALQQELLAQVRASWRRGARARSSDPIDQIAHEMRTSRRWVELSLRRSGDLPPSLESPRATKTKTPRRPRKPRK